MGEFSIVCHMLGIARSRLVPFGPTLCCCDERRERNDANPAGVRPDLAEQVDGGFDLLEYRDARTAE